MDPYAESGPERDRYRKPLEPGPAGRRLLLAGVLLSLFAAMLWIRVAQAGGWEQTSLFYVGVPAVLALTVVATARPRSAVGTAMAVTTIGLALAGPLLGEGIVCLVMAAPLFYALAAAIGWALGGSFREGPRAVVLGVLLAPLALEGVGGLDYLPRPDTGLAEQVVAAPVDQVTAALAARPEYDVPGAPLLRLGFPRPLEAEGTGLAVGAQRTVTFTSRRALAPGARPVPRSMHLVVTESEIGPEGGRVVFTVAEDTTLARWLDFREAEVVWRAAGRGTELIWNLRYERTFDPSWYWRPLQRYAMNRAADYLASTFAEAAARKEEPALSGGTVSGAAPGPR